MLLSIGIYSGVFFEALAAQDNATPAGGIVALTQPPAAGEEGKCSIQGKVVSQPGGQGIRKVKVSFRRTGRGNGSNYEAVTDESGQFKLDGLPDGNYLVTVERAGYAVDRKTKSLKVIKLEAGESKNDLVFQMLPAGVITGKIVDTDGDPLRNVSVVAVVAGGMDPRRGGGGNSGSASTNDLGEYRIPDLLPGKYIIEANIRGQVHALPSSNAKDTPQERTVYAKTYFPGTLDRQQASPLVVPSGGTATANFGVLMAQAYRLTGTVAGLGSEPRAMAQLTLLSNNGESQAQQISPDGKFQFENVLPGIYHAQVMSASFSNGPPSVKMLNIRTPIDVTGGDLLGLELQLDVGGDVSGRLRLDGDGKMNWQELHVGLMPVLENQQEPDVKRVAFTQPAQVQEDGSFVLKDQSSGTYQLLIFTNSDKWRDFYTKSVLSGGREVADSGFDVNGGMQLDVVVSSKGAAIEGTVVDANGKPVAEATVVTMPSSGKVGRPDAYQTGSTDDKGHFSLRGINPGEFLVLAFESMPVNFRAPSFATKYQAKGEKVDLEESTKKSVTLTLIPDDEN